MFSYMSIPSCCYRLDWRYWCNCLYQWNPNLIWIVCFWKFFGRQAGAIITANFLQVHIAFIFQLFLFDAFALFFPNSSIFLISRCLQGAYKSNAYHLRKKTKPILLFKKHAYGARHRSGQTLLWFPRICTQFMGQFGNQWSVSFSVAFWTLSRSTSIGPRGWKTGITGKGMLTTNGFRW